MIGKHKGKDWIIRSSVCNFSLFVWIGNSQWLFVLEQYAEFDLLFVLQWEYFLQMLEKYSSFSISIILLQ